MLTLKLAVHSRKVANAHWSLVANRSRVRGELDFVQENAFTLQE